MTDKKHWFWIVFLLGLVVSLIYWDLPKTFFQQDEWWTFSTFIYWRSIKIGEAINDFLFQDVALHLMPLTRIISFFQFQLFGLNFVPYAFFDISLHLANSLLVFYLFFILWQEKHLAFFASLIFAFNSLSHQVISWQEMAIAAGGSCFFVLCSLIFFYRYLEEQKKKWFRLSFLSFLIALGFKETSTFLFLFLPLLLFIFFRRKKLPHFKRAIFSFFVAGFGYGLIRFMFLLNSANFINQAQLYPAPPRIVYLFRMLIFPLRIISQSIFSAERIILWAKGMVRFAYPHFQEQVGTTAYDLVAETVTADFISYILSILIILFSLIIMKYLKTLQKENLAKTIALALIFIAISSFPFIFIPGYPGYFSLFEPRHLYISLIASSALITLFIFSFSQWLAEKTRQSFYVYFLLFLIPLAFFHIKNIRRDLAVLVRRSQIRKRILVEIKNSYPDLPEKVVFYIVSDTAYYGLPPEETTLPFQTGPGKSLLVWYADEEKYPPCFFEDIFLYEPLASQGYRFCQGRGFGYFSEYDKLIQALKSEHIPIENVIAYSWEGETERFEDISEPVRQKLEQDLFLLQNID